MGILNRIQRAERQLAEGGCSHPCHQPRPIRTIEVPAGAPVPSTGGPSLTRCPICGGKPWDGITTIIVEIPEGEMWPTTAA